MARTSLAHIPFPRKWRGFADRTGSFTITDDASTPVAAKVYNAATGTGTITSPYPFIYGCEPVGFLEPGRHHFASGGYTFTYDVPDTAVGNDHLATPALGPRTIPYHLCNSDAVTLTSQTVIFAKLEPITTTFTGTSVVCVVGLTESATETDQRIGVYSSDGTTLTLMNQSAASTAMLETDDTVVTSALAATITLVPGIAYYAAIMSNATTAGTLVGWTPVGIGAATPALAATEAPLTAYTLASETTLAATHAISGLTASAIIPYMQVI